MKVYHNPRCSKSRETVALLDEKGVEYETVLYLEDAPNQEELENLVGKLGIEAKELVRTGEPVYNEKYKGKKLSEKQWIKAMVANPNLIQRPIVVKGNKAVLGRPPEKVLELL